jgi:hypothetical protein
VGSKAVRHPSTTTLAAQAPHYQAKRCSCGQSIRGSTCSSCSKRQARVSRKESGPAVLDERRREQVLAVLRSSGAPLEAATRSQLEPWFGRDFSRVRVHTDASAATSAKMLNATAYTVGRHIVFATGLYAPDEVDGRKLLVHELTHVVQQEHVSDLPIADITLGPSGDALEREADRASERFSPVAQPRSGSSYTALPAPVIQRNACGPDVTEQIKTTWQKVQSDFRSVWKPKDKLKACDYLIQPRVPIDPDDKSLTPATQWNTDAFDTLPLFHMVARNWLLDNGVVAAGCGVPTSADKTTAKEYENPDLCSMSVQVKDQCWLSGTVNYGTYGVMCRLCKDFDLDYFDIYFQAKALLYAYKARIFSRASTTKEDDISVPFSWFKATYEGGPGATPTGAGNRSKNCPCSCRLTGNMVKWDYVWEPAKRRYAATLPGAPNTGASGSGSGPAPPPGPARRGMSGDHEPSGPREV